MSKKASNIALAFLNLVFFLGMVAVNALANILPINNLNTGQISDMYPNLFVPSGLTFSIWGLIYALLALFIIYQLVVSFKASGEGLFRKIGILFILSSAFNIGWIFSWHYQIVWLSLIIMVLLLVTLIALYSRLRIGRSDASNGEKYLVHMAFSFYLGWITIATIANVSAFLVDLGWNGFGLSPQFWTVLVIAVGIIINLIALFKNHDIFYALVAVWAFLGILLKRMADTSMPDLAVEIAAIVGMAVLALGIIVQLIRKKVY